MTQSYPIATIGTEDGLTDETFLSQSSSTGMSASEMLATELFTPEMSATKMSTIDTSTAEIFLIKMSANEMSTAETSADKMSAAECQLIKYLHLGYSLVKCLTLNSYYWACTNKYLLKNCAIDLSATEMFTNRLKFLLLKYLPLKYPPLKYPPLNCYYLVIVIIYYTFVS